MLFRLMFLLFNKEGGPLEKEPWQKGNSELIGVSIIPTFTVTKVKYEDTYETEKLTAGISDVIFDVVKVYYHDSVNSENLISGITDIVFTVTKI